MVQVESFPQYSERMQSACCKSILKVLVAMASKGPVLWGFISSVGMFTMNMMGLFFIKHLFFTLLSMLVNGKYVFPNQNCYEIGF